MNPLINAELAAMRTEDLTPTAHGRRSRPARGATVFRGSPRRGGSV
jgi:hypothetical protein